MGTRGATPTLQLRVSSCWHKLWSYCLVSLYIVLDAIRSLVLPWPDKFCVPQVLYRKLLVTSGAWCGNRWYLSLSWPPGEAPLPLIFEVNCVIEMQNWCLDTEVVVHVVTYPWMLKKKWNFVCLRVVERGRVKCGQYWPLEEGRTEQHGYFLVRNTHIQVFQDFKLSHLELYNTQVSHTDYVSLIALEVF